MKALAIYYKHEQAQKFLPAKFSKNYTKIQRSSTIANASLFKLEKLQDIKTMAKRVAEQMPHCVFQVRRINI